MFHPDDEESDIWDFLPGVMAITAALFAVVGAMAFAFGYLIHRYI